MLSFIIRRNSIMVSRDLNLGCFVSVNRFLLCRFFTERISVQCISKKTKDSTGFHHFSNFNISCSARTIFFLPRLPLN